MAMTALERKHRSLERKEAKARAVGDPTDVLASQPFYQFLNSHRLWRDIEQNLDLVEGAAPQFNDDSDSGWLEDGWDGPFRGSIGRAERMVTVYLDFAATVARMINDYKREAIESALVQLEQSDLSDPVIKAKALADTVRLNKMRDQLDKSVRWELPQWRIKSP